MKPVIGITAYAQDAQWSHWSLPAALVPLSYVESVDRAGGRPLVIPPSEDGVEETLAVLDGLVFSGGADIDPRQYGDERHPTTSVEVRRDRAERLLLEAALARDVPVLAVCRGMQLLNVVYGGNLHQHLPERLGHNGHRVERGAFSSHEVRLAAGSRAATLAGPTALVKSTHHQAPARVGHGLVAVGWAEDGTVEALEDPERAFAVGVLWHPEEGEDKRLFEGLVEEARRYREARVDTSVPARSP